MRDTPGSCGLCGIEQRGHGIQAGASGSHTWEQPTQQQIKDRMLARRAERNEMSETRIRADILFEAVDLPKVEFDKLKARIGEIADEHKATVTINGRMYPGAEREQPGGRLEDPMITPLTDQRFEEIRQGQPTEWLPNPWKIHQIESDGEAPGCWQVLHEGTVIATLPDWAGNLALWMAGAPEDIRDLLTEVERCRTSPPSDRVAD